jgi:YD repeat-containing protein
MPNYPFKSVYLFLVISLFFSCKSQDDNGCTVNDGKLVERMILTDVESGREERSFFIYNTQNQLDSIVGDATNLRTYTFKYNAQKQLIERTTFTHYNQKTEKVSIDSLVYDAQNRLIKIREFSTNGGVGLGFLWTRIYSYNAQDKVEKEIVVYKNDTFRTKIYEWQGDNVVKTTDFNEKGIKEFEATYKYDTKNNPFLTTPNTYDRVESRNNIIEVVYVDFSGLLDLIANPATSKYCYNSSKFPTVKTTNIGYKYTFCYK